MNTLKITLTILALISVTIVWAQPSPPPATPIDGGLSMLLVAGGLYGVKKLRDHRRN